MRVLSTRKGAGRTGFILGLAVASIAFGVTDSTAQIVSGRVVDATTDAPIPQTYVVAVSGGSVVARTLGTAGGDFSLRVPGPGIYELQATRLGYTAESVVIDVRGEDLVIEIRMTPAPVALDPLSVSARSGRIPREVSVDGLYARRQWVLPVGSERVFVRGDREFDNSPRVVEVLRWFRAARGCVVYFVNGMPQPPQINPKEFVETMPTAHLEGIEFYRDSLTVPLDYQGYGCWGAAGLYSIIAIWYRQ